MAKVVGNAEAPRETLRSKLHTRLKFFLDAQVPEPQKYVELERFGLFLKALGHSFTYLWGPGRTSSVVLGGLS